MRFRTLYTVALALCAVIGGCASVATQITLLDPAQKFPPSGHVSIVFEYPPQPYIKLALIEAQGMAGGSEAALLEEARKRAAALGADAVVRLEVTSFYQPPVLVYDPTYSNMFYPHHRYAYRYFYPQPSPGPFFPRDDYRWVGGGEVPALKCDGHSLYARSIADGSGTMSSNQLKDWWRARPDSNGRPSASEADTLSS